jgi:hypothetical protein
MTFWFWLAVYWSGCFWLLLDWMKRNGEKVDSVGIFLLLAIAAFFVPPLAIVFFIAKLLALNNDRD